MLRCVRGGLRVQLLENGCIHVSVPTSTLHPNKDEVQLNADGVAYVYSSGERRYKIGDLVKVNLPSTREETRGIIGPINHLMTTSLYLENTARCTTGGIFIVPKLVTIFCTLIVSDERILGID